MMQPNFYPNSADAHSTSYKSKTLVLIFSSSEIALGIARILTPRPLLCASNFLSAALGWANYSTYSPLCCFMFLFLTGFFCISEIFSLISKFTGPFGSSWLHPKYYWQSRYPNTFSYRGMLFPYADMLSSTSRGDAPTVQVHALPPEVIPQQWQIYLELVCDCLNPVVYLIGMWCAWSLYKELMQDASETEPLLANQTINYTANFVNPSTFTEESRESVRNAGAPTTVFVPFGGEGMKLGELKHKSFDKNKK